MGQSVLNEGFPCAFSGNSHEVRYKMALTAAAARLREETQMLHSRYSLQLLHTAKLLEAMAGEAET